MYPPYKEEEMVNETYEEDDAIIFEYKKEGRGYVLDDTSDYFITIQIT